MCIFSSIFLCTLSVIVTIKSFTFRKRGNFRLIFKQVDLEAEAYAKPVKAFVELLIYQDGAGYAAATASLAALNDSVKAAFPSKPPQSVADIVTLYQHASAIKQAFDQVGEGLADLILYCSMKPVL